MDRVTCERQDRYIDVRCIEHDGFGPRGRCERPHRSYCQCCWDYLINPDSIAAGYCVGCRRRPEHQGPPTVTARSVWPA